jgi:uncharacterized protein
MYAEENRDTRMWAILCHASALLGYVTLVGFIVGPLVVWLLKREESPEIDEHGRESLNFQISILIYGVVLGMAAFILSFVFIGFLLVPVIFILPIAQIVLVIIASIKASNGEPYRYPFTIRLF